MEIDGIINNSYGKIHRMKAIGRNVTSPEQRLDRITRIVAYARERFTFEYQNPVIGIVCGSGLSNLTSLMTDKLTIPYSEIPDFPMATVVGHSSEMVVGRLNGIVTVGLRGRFHYYEGHELMDVVLPIQVLSLLGCKTVVITNAAGGIDETFMTGDLMVIEDHISFLGLSGVSPLRGANLGIGPRFPALTEAYLPESFELISQAASKLGITGIKRGIYVGVGGPSYETPAEVRFLRGIGGSAVGMSTVPEVVAAVHAGMKVIAVSLITNVAISRDERTRNIPKPTHEEVLEATKTRARDLERIVFELMPTLAKAESIV